MKARLVRVADLIESVGLPNVRAPHVRHLRGEIELALQRAKELKG